MIRKMSDDYKLPEVTGMKNEALADKVEHLKTTRKQELIDTGTLAKGVTKVDTEALLMYQGIYYKEINEHLRTGTAISSHAAEAVKRLDKMIAKSALGNDTILYRGFGLKNQLAIGDTFNDKGFLSMSRDNIVGRSFAFGANDPYKYLLRVKVPQGYHGLDVNAILLERSEYPYEKEILLGRGQNYIIKGMSEPDENGIVDVDIALVDKSGKELSDPNIRVITAEEIEAADKLLGVDGDYTPSEEELSKIHEKMRSYNQNITVTRADGTTFTT